MAIWLRQSTAVDVPVGPFLDDTDGKTAETLLTITQPDVRLKKNAGNWAQKNAAQTLSHEENGWYELSLDTTDTDTLGVLIVAIHESGALPVWREFMVVPAQVWDSFLGADVLQVHAIEIANDLITAAAIAADAIGASELAAGAVTEIQSGLATSAALATVQSDTDNIQTRLPAALVGGRMDSDIGAKTGNVALSAQEKLDVNAEVDTALVDVDLDHLSQVTYGAELPTAGSIIDQIMNKDAGQTFNRATDSLEAIRDTLSLVTAALIADAVWDEALAGHVSAGSTGNKLDLLKTKVDLGR